MSTEGFLAMLMAFQIPTPRDRTEYFFAVSLLETEPEHPMHAMYSMY